MLTVAQVLQFPSMTRGVPEVLAGGDSLDAAVRWVHIGEFKHLLLKGGELVLSSGQGFSKTAAGQREFVHEISQRGAVGLVIELGSVYQSVPRAIVDVCTKLDFPLIALHREVAFVEITEAVHAHLVDCRVSTMERVETSLHGVTHLLLRGAHVDKAVSALADIVGNPLVLERGDGSALAVATGRRSHDEVVLAWESVVRGFSNAPPSAFYQIEAMDQPRVGRLVVLGLDKPIDEFDRVVLTRAASLLGLVQIHPEDEGHDRAEADGRIVADLLKGNVSDTYARTRAEANGFRGQWLMPVAIGRSERTVLRDFREESELWDRTSRRITSEFAQLHMPAVTSGRGSDWEALLVIGLNHTNSWTRVMDRVADVVHRVAGEIVDSAHCAAVIAAAPPVDSWADVSKALEECTSSLRALCMATPRRWHNVSTPDLDRFLWKLRGNPEFGEFVRGRLAELLDQRNTMFLQTVEAYFAHGGRKAEVARALNIERPSLYHRIERINKLLGADIRDPDIALGLHLALRARPYLYEGSHRR